MQLRRTLLALALPSVLFAQQTPFFVQIESYQPFSAARLEIGKRPAYGTTLGFAFSQKSGKKISLEVEGLITTQQHREGPSRTEAQFTGIGMGFRGYFNSQHRGFYFGASGLVEHTAITHRNPSGPTEESFTRPASRLFTGYRFEGGHLELIWQERTWDEDRRFAYLGIGLGIRL